MRMPASRAIDTHARQGAEGRAGGADRRRPQGRRHQADPAGRVDHGAGRGAAQTARTWCWSTRTGRISRRRTTSSPSTRSAMSAKAVVLVVAETLAIAKDAAELVAIDYEPLPAVTDTAAAAEPDAARAVRRCALEPVLRRRGRRRRRDRARRSPSAAHVVRLDTWVQRVTGVPMEARTAVGNYDKQSRPLLPACGLRRRGAAEGRVRGDPRRAGGDRAGRGARHRRQFRHQEFAVPGIPAGAVGGEARRPAGEMDLRALARRSSATTRAATSSPRSSLRSTPRANSWRCAART